jgi:DNA/RNA endonuclease YhcR with UshA esterase domain
LNNKKIGFIHHPEEVDFINVSSDIMVQLKNIKMIYFTSDPVNPFKAEIAQVEYQLGRVMDEEFNIYAIAGFTDDTIFPNQLKITCENATQTTPVILFEEANQTIIDRRDGCIIAGSESGENFGRIRDRILYGMYGVIE